MGDMIDEGPIVHLAETDERSSAFANPSPIQTRVGARHVMECAKERALIEAPLHVA